MAKQPAKDERVKASVFLTREEHEACMIEASRNKMSLSQFISDMVRRKFKKKQLTSTPESQ